MVVLARPSDLHSGVDECGDCPRGTTGLPANRSDRDRPFQRTLAHAIVVWRAPARGAAVFRRCPPGNKAVRTPAVRLRGRTESHRVARWLAGSAHNVRWPA